MQNQPSSGDYIHILCTQLYVFVCSYDSQDAKPGDVVCYGQYVTLTTLPNEGGQVCEPVIE